MRTLLDLEHLAGSAIYSVLGMAIFGLGLIIFDKLTPYQLWKEIIDEHNMALAILLAAMALGLSIIIAASILG